VALRSWWASDVEGQLRRRRAIVAYLEGVSRDNDLVLAYGDPEPAGLREPMAVRLECLQGAAVGVRSREYAARHHALAPHGAKRSTVTINSSSVLLIVRLLNLTFTGGFGPSAGRSSYGSLIS